MKLATRQLGEIAFLLMGQSPSGETYNEEGQGLPFFQGKSEFGNIYPTTRKWCSSPVKIAEAGDILISVRAPVGPTNLATERCCIGRGLAAIRPNPCLIERDYLWLFLKYVEPVLVAKGQGSTFEAICGSDLSSLRVTLPELPAQRRIAASLKTQLAAVEEARSAAQAQRKEVDALWTALYSDAFDDIVPIVVPPTFDAAPDGWRWEKLLDLARLESGHTPSRFRSDWWGGDVSWISLTEIRALDGRWVKETEIKTNDAGIANSAARILPRGTVCFSRTASVGFVAIMDTPMATSQDFANWVCSDRLDPEFLMHALIRSRTQLRAIATGATHKTIYMPTLQAFHICLPPRSEQERIVEQLKQQLAAVRELKIASQATLNEIEGLPSRLLAQAFANLD